MESIKPKSNAIKCWIQIDFTGLPADSADLVIMKKIKDYSFQL